MIAAAVAILTMTVVSLGCSSSTSELRRVEQRAPLAGDTHDRISRGRAHTGEVDESVSEAWMPLLARHGSGRGESLGVGLSLIAEEVEAGSDHKGRRQVRQIGCAERRLARIGLAWGRSGVVPSESVAVFH